MIGFIGLAQAGEFIRMGQPIEFATVYDGAAHAGAMTIHIFCGGMGNNIGTPFNGTTVDGSGEGVIHDEGYAVAMSGLGEFLNIQHGEGGVSNGFAENSLSIILKSGV